MPDLRPVVASEQVLGLLSQHFNTPISGLVAVEGGQVARTFAFRAGEQEYIIRFNLDKMLGANFPKEAYLARKLAATSIPLAPILHVGHLRDLQFVISRKMPGKMVGDLTPQEVRALMPQILDMLEAVHCVDTSETRGYGVFDYQGQGLDSSWHRSLAKIIEEEDEKDYFGKWHHLFNETFLERDLYENLHQRMTTLLAHCPENRNLIFGGMSLRNLLAQEGKITAVLDLLDASYGDVVYDIVSLDFWSPWLGVRGAFQEYQQQRGRELPFYAERLLCYACHHALIGLRFFAQGGNEAAYQMVRAIIQQKLDAFAS